MSTDREEFSEGEGSAPLLIQFVGTGIDIKLAFKQDSTFGNLSKTHRKKPNG